MLDKNKLNPDNVKIAVIGLGYVGLPLAVEFGKQYETIGFDVNAKRVDQLNNGIDITKETTEQDLKGANLLSLTCKISDINTCNVYIVTVPTPIDEQKQPDLAPLRSASKMIAGCLSFGDVVVYESTVYPGVTEDVCVPILEKESSLKYNCDFYAGYSPERINPGDKTRPLKSITKVTSGSTEAVALFVDSLYSSIISAGTFKASSIKVAEASKVIENVQRDVNIALVNELHQIFDKLGIDTKDVIEAASTKWNFMKLFPGLVGGHCIGVDPYYLLHKAESKGYIPDLMRSAREINNGMPTFVASTLLRKLIEKKINPVECKVLILGFTFKEDCPDLRNTKVYDLYTEVKSLGLQVSIYDPLVNTEEAKREYGVEVINQIVEGFDVGLLAVSHASIISSLEANEFKFSENYVFDFKGALN